MLSVKYESASDLELIMHALLRMRWGHSHILSDPALSTKPDGMLAAVMQSLLGPLADPHRLTSSHGHLVLLSCCERQQQGVQGAVLRRAGIFAQA